MRTITDNGQTTAYFEAPSRLWHDLDKTIPALPGMTVASLEVFIGGKPFADLVQPVVARRPVCVMDRATGQMGVFFDTGEAAWNAQTIYAPYPPPTVALSNRPMSSRVTTTFTVHDDGSQTILDQSGNGNHWRIDPGNPPMNHPDFKWPE